MRWRSTLGFVAVVLAASCSFPFAAQSGARVAFELTVLPASGPSRAVARFLAPETTTIRVTVSTTGTADQTLTYTPVVDSASGVAKARVEVQTTPGLHTFLVEGLDATNAVLTSAQVSQFLVDGPNQVTLTLTPPNTLANGAAFSLAASQVAYFLVPGASLAIFQISGANSTFSEGSATGTFAGAGTVGALTVDVTAGVDKLLRVVQGTAGSFTAVIPQVAAVAFSVAGGTYVQDQTIALTDATPGASIVFSVDGGTTYAPYTGAIAVAGNGTIKTILAKATLPGFTPSVTTTQSYTIAYSGVTTGLPTEPTILGTNTPAPLNATNSDTYTVALDPAAAFTTYTWFIDGTPGQYQMGAGWTANGTSFTLAGNSLVVQSQYLTTGRHEVMVVVTDPTGTYSARLTVEVVR